MSSENWVTEVWYVAGDPDSLLFRTKLDAEIHALDLYPHSDSDYRYGKIYYRTVYTFGDSSENDHSRQPAQDQAQHQG